MRLNRFLTATCFAVSFASIPMFADIVVSTVSGTGQFIPMPPGPYAAGNPGGTPKVTPNQPGHPYWDHQSQDATLKADQCNVGSVVTGTMSSTCANVNGMAFNNDDGAPNSYWAQSSSGSYGNFDSSFYFNNTDQPDATELEITITGWSTDSFGWYDHSAPGTLHELFTAKDNGKMETFGANITAANFGFYITSKAGTFRTESGLNTGDTQQFAVFRVAPGCGPTPGVGGPVCKDQTTASSYYIGAEDNVYPNSDYDYNDMVVHITQAAVPEPGSILLFSTMLLGCGIAFRRRFRA